MSSNRDLARYALQSNNLDQAVLLYEAALAKAYARDDVKAIGDVGYELSLALLRNGRPTEAAAQARRIQQELERRGRTPFAELHLVEAAAELNAGRPDSAGRAAQMALRKAGTNDAATRGRAYYVLGSISADARDEPALSAAVAQLESAREPALRADFHELNGRQALLRSAPKMARRDFEASAKIRRMLLDYSGMARALAFAGEAAESSGDRATAADFYFRAGRSAMERGALQEARGWLEKALALASDDPEQSELAREAEDMLRRLLDEVSARPAVRNRGRLADLLGRGDEIA